MAMHAFHLQYGRRLAGRVAERDRIQARERAVGSSAVADDISASFGATAKPDIVSVCEEWKRVERGELDPSIAVRLIEGREAGEREQRRQKEAEAKAKIG